MCGFMIIFAVKPIVISNYRDVTEIEDAGEDSGDQVQADRGRGAGYVGVFDAAAHVSRGADRYGAQQRDRSAV